MRFTIVLACALMSLTPAMGQVSVSVAVPGLSIGINVPTYPELVPVPGYPVYYAPRLGPTTSSTTACTGSTSATPGIRAPGTTGLGAP